MITASFVVALAGLASAVENASPFQAADIYSLNGAGLANGFSGLAARDDQCLASQAVCGTDLCMPKGGSCCDKVKGTYCDVGFYCYAQGCCPNGKVCRGGPTDGCASGKQECGSVCIAGSSVCCNPKASSNNVWCEYPKSCGADGKCVSRALVTGASAAPSSTSSPLGYADATETGGVAATSGGSSAKATGDGGDGTSSKGDKKTPVGAIVGGVVGGVAAIALVGVGVLLLLRHKRKQKDAAQGQNMQQQQPPPNQPLMRQYPPHTSPYMANASPAQGTGCPPSPPGSPPPLQGYYNTCPPVGQYSPSVATGQVSSPTGTYSTDPRTGAPTVSPVGFATVGATPTPPPARQGHNGNEKPVVYEMSAKPGDDHRGNIHELA
ncbi:hypothetical protein J3458_000404 [Metarhizium acridum]|uniref:Uncharacterized protein n=1 Tax=Metarhizium acridum (strain CQMa 102) TaxID=655827 RepID=E9EEI1_METAQ|nr:uncharacterized protein MAC_08279 [Metarhizium acridum CQMa 102]EFY85688.1 hypothetical protein MAC_08279 [Metarhizium acridum CQMa 102]KAG8423516.1 hypothetical protein J3458_000404 [Metarhizium acridum]